MLAAATARGSRPGRIVQDASRSLLPKGEAPKPWWPDGARSSTPQTIDTGASAGQRLRLEAADSSSKSRPVSPGIEGGGCATQRTISFDSHALAKSSAGHKAAGLPTPVAASLPSSSSHDSGSPSSSPWEPCLNRTKSVDMRKIQRARKTERALKAEQLKRHDASSEEDGLSLWIGAIIVACLTCGFALFFCLAPNTYRVHEVIPTLYTLGLQTGEDLHAKMTDAEAAVASFANSEQQLKCEAFAPSGGEGADFALPTGTWEQGRVCMAAWQERQHLFGQKLQSQFTISTFLLGIIGFDKFMLLLIVPLICAVAMTSYNFLQRQICTFWPGFVASTDDSDSAHRELIGDGEGQRSTVKPKKASKFHRSAVVWIVVLFAMALPTFFWLFRVAKLCSQLESYHIEFYSEYTRFLGSLIGMPLQPDAMLQRPRFDCPLVLFVGSVLLMQRGVITTCRRNPHTFVRAFQFQGTYSVLGTMVGLTGLWVRFAPKYLAAVRHRQKQNEDAKKLAARNFKDIIQFSLCSLDEKLTFRQFTLFEMPLIELVKKSEVMQKALLVAAENVTYQCPFLHTLEEQHWKTMRGFIISELSSKFYAGYVARDLGCPIVFDKYYFGLVNEVPKKGRKSDTSLKLRVIIASEKLLQFYDELAALGRALDPDDPVSSANRVRLGTGYFRDRWEITLRNMADLYNDPSSTSLRQIELCVAANRIELTRLDGKLDMLKNALCTTAWDDQHDWKQARPDH